MSQHISVLHKEVLEGLDLDPNDIVVDGTINGGGHAELIANTLSPNGVLIGIDQDSTGLAISKERLKDAPAKIHLIHDNSRNIDAILDNLGYPYINKLLLDLGWSTNQFEKPERGFSFLKEGPLLMTLSDNPETNIFTAYDVVNTWEEDSLLSIIRGYGEERYAQRIVEAIIRARENEPIVTTKQLADIIYTSVPSKYRHQGIHPATKTFQAIRIAVNDEMGALKEILEKAFERLARGGRMVVISFHSIEDRIVKQTFKTLKDEQKAIVVTKRPITASQEELLENKRSRSAKLRIIQKI